MQEHFTRRHDLFADAGFDDPAAAIEALGRDACAIGLLSGDADARSESAAHVDLEHCLVRAGGVLGDRLSGSAVTLIDGAAEWLFERGGDLATFLWLARRLSSQPLDLGALVLGLGRRLLEAGRKRETAGLLRFLVNVDFDFGKLYHEPGLAYGFFQPREPNPFVWKILRHVDERRARFPGEDFEALRVLELGSGIGNDALGFLSSPLVSGYVGTDLSGVALERLRSRAAPVLEGRGDLALELREGDFAQELSALAGRPDHGVGLVYSYSSLHYFSSLALEEIFHRIRLLLEPGRGLFAFAIKGEGSVWQGQGVPIYRPDVWINFDGQSRWFPSREAIVALTDRMGFEIRLHELAEHWGYSEVGEKDIFHHVVCAPRR